MSGVSFKAYVAALGALSLTLAASWAYQFGVVFGARYVVGALAFAAVLALAELYPARVSEHSEVSAVDAGLVLAAVILGPLWAIPAALSCAVVEGNRNPLRTFYAASRNAAEVLLAGVAFSFVALPLLSSGGSVPTAVAVYATLGAAVVLHVANNVFHAGLLKAKYGQPFEETWENVVRPYLLSDGVNVLTAGLGTLALLHYGPVAAVVLVTGAIGSQALVLHSREHARRSRELEAENDSLKRALAGAGTTFGSLVVEALGSKDGRADRCAAATAVYAYDLAREMNLDEKRAQELRLAGLLHDVGLVFLPEELLLASGRLNSVAQARLAEHPALGEAALATVTGYEEIARWVRWHHERPDGRGYPDRLRGPWIPLEAKILAVAQAHANLVLDGANLPGISLQEARKCLVAGIDSEFDGATVRAFLRTLDTESEGYRMADDHRFVLPGRSDTLRAFEASEALEKPSQ